ncbi:glutamine--fructose-6-phosphate transaminase (isomerizing) [Wolbachia endosymbiont of Dirofilaria (Dirofilaria) immitis]|uniref:glutamine--fructose-6-phosphate transaminase (isomerizing) n=1 Tax=Wolbachia endosymbiont of Dirofilaria (Dirofilaria) immitis TaxID=1812115 RepID=UPI00158B141A|nr:glutamine--fructose-6-phosphate transaminase (isomerizing) [Wolbachia endosymbiont of Dirofilaria (Dirofilaria) immitis]QKX02580.1 glutamine--fructose-6-phosphate transaminase (isomerizing) [Wolbachia endosymbiont of Dirofilaria (Dirofilaria) immitis]
MCGIFGVVSNGGSVVPTLLTGLRRLEYRGYDSSGIAIINNKGKIEVKKSEGRVERLCDVVNNSKISSSTVGIAHTRWATHGVPSLKNAHPIYINNVVVAHNGIIENYNLLKKSLEKRGIKFHTDTDTEIIPNMLTMYLNEGLSPIDSLSKCLSNLHGPFALVLLFAECPDALFVAKRNLPLMIGYNHNTLLATSDFNTLGTLVKKISHLEDGDIAVIKSSGAVIYNNGVRVERNIESNSPNNFSISKNGYHSFMLKEIFEQPCTLNKTINQFYKKYTEVISTNKKLLSKINHITIVGCGSSYFAGLIAKYWLESIAQIRVYLEISSEFRYSNIRLEEGSFGLFISQSGETADTVEALRYGKSQKQIIISITNTLNSSIEKISDIVLHTLAGPEIGVASTKTFSAQLAILACFALELAKIKGTLSKKRIKQLSDAINSIPEYVEYVLNAVKVQSISGNILEHSNIILIGRGSSYGVAMEGALKIKELSYINTTGIAAGEMKHGSIALIDSSVLVIAIIPYDNLFFKTLSNIQEITARKGKVIAFSDKQGASFLREACTDIVQLPGTDSFIAPVTYSIAMQFLAYSTAVKKGLDADYPRNLAKSITVE